MHSPVLVSIQVGTPRTVRGEGTSDPRNRPWTTAIYKSPVSGPIVLGVTGLAGDAQADAVSHGGPDKAVCAYSQDHFGAWLADPGFDGLAGGGFGENFTIRGLTEADICVGDIWSAGDVRLQVSQPRQPCWKLARKWGMENLVPRVIASGRTGWYFRVVREGEIEAGVPLTLVDRPFGAWTIRAANAVMHQRPVDLTASAALAAVAALSRSWREALAARTRP
jgi:MOSC domain-containing protein YiiM